jgi:anaerobic selenocysteine-containing dehydrogenase
MRMLDRLYGPNRPRLLVVDPRPTPVAREADLHLAIRNGTNLAVLNALVQQLIARDWIEHDYVEENAVGFEELAGSVAGCTPEWAAPICGVDAREIEAAAELIGTSERLFSTVLQGVYQSHQATAAACQVNNIHILRGMLGRPGCGLLQMNGQPTAQNTRETGANGDFPGFRNWANDAHVDELAHLWNVEPAQIPHYGPPTHAMEIFRYCEQGSIKFLWVSATNPAVSLPELNRIRSILADERLFLVVQDIFLSETASFADVVLPAATWGEKLGTFTNADRTVHLSEKAVDPPGDARPDMDIFRDYAERMRFTDRDGAPLIKWETPEGAFEAWKECSRGRPCDYTAITYQRLRQKHDIQWPATTSGPTARSASTAKPTSGPAQRSASPTAKTSSPAPRSSPSSTWHSTPTARQSSKPPTTCRPKRNPTTNAPSGSTRAEPSSTSTPARKPPERPSCRPPRPTPGSSSPPPTLPPSESPRATWSRSPPHAARSAPRHASAPFATAWSSFPSTTATGTPTTAAHQTLPPAPPTN